MTRLLWLAGGCVASWLALSLAIGGTAFQDVGFGMVGPLAAASGSWVMIERTFRRDPARVTPLMYQSLLLKMVFFAAYIVVGIQGLSLRPTAFVVSFAAYFLTLHVIEAIWLRRLFASAVPVPR
jgi:hypothetical protein